MKKIFLILVVGFSTLCYAQYEIPLPTVAPTALGIKADVTTCCIEDQVYTLELKNVADNLFFQWFKYENGAWDYVYTNSSTIDIDVSNEGKIYYYLVTYRIGNNSIPDGDFERGRLGFATSDYEEWNDKWHLYEGCYGIIDSRNNITQFQNMSTPVCIQNHTPNGSHFLAVNGDVTYNKVAWRTTIRVDKNTDYAFTAWARDLSLDLLYDSYRNQWSRAQLRFSINDVQLGGIVEPIEETCEWEQLVASWHSGDATTAKIEILSQSTASFGNDFGIDDISFNKLVKNGEYLFEITSKSCADPCEGVVPDKRKRDTAIYADCGAFKWNGQKITTHGIYTHTWKSIIGCDSLLDTLIVTTIKPHETKQETKICVDDTIYLGSQMITKEGVYIDTIPSIITGCDSAYYILTVKEIEATAIQKIYISSSDSCACGDTAKVSYVVTYTGGIPINYSVSFDDKGKQAGWIESFRTITNYKTQDDSLCITLALPHYKGSFLRPNDYDITFTIEDLCHRKHVLHQSFKVLYPTSVIDQHWNDVFAIFAPKYIGGYEFSAFQWYKNDEPISLATGDFYYAPLSPQDVYFARLTRKDDNYTTFTCKVIPKEVSDQHVVKEPFIELYPTLVSKDNPTIYINTNKVGTYHYEVYDTFGHFYEKNSVEITDYRMVPLTTLPPYSTTFIIRLNGKSYVIVVK